MSEFINCGTVCCVLLPCDGGLILIRRGDRSMEGYGELALPGGFQEGRISEPVRLTAAREVKEETGLVINPALLSVVNVETDEYRHNVIFFEYPNLGSWPEVARQLAWPANEILAVERLLRPIDTAFPFHTQEVFRWFERQNSRG